MPLPLSEVNGLSFSSASLFLLSSSCGCFPLPKRKQSYPSLLSTDAAVTPASQVPWSPLRKFWDFSLNHTKFTFFLLGAKDIFREELIFRFSSRTFSSNQSHANRALHLLLSVPFAFQLWRHQKILPGRGGTVLGLYAKWTAQWAARGHKVKACSRRAGQDGGAVTLAVLSIASLGHMLPLWKLESGVEWGRRGKQPKRQRKLPSAYPPASTGRRALRLINITRNFAVRIVLAMSSETFHLFWVLVHLGRVVLNNLSNIIYGRWFIQIFLPLLQSILVIYISLESNRLSLDLIMYWYQVT